MVMTGGERRTIKGVNFIRVKGTAAERARAHGRLLRDEIRAGALPVLAKKNEWLIRRGPGLVQLGPVQEAIVWFYKKVLIPFLDRQTTQEYRDVMRALSEETGLSYETCRESLFQPDGFMLLSRTSVMKYVLKDLPQGGLPACSSGIALKEWTADGRMLVCRNQDYPVQGSWEPGTTVIFQDPSEEGQLPHVCVTTAGVHTAGLTAMNREGLTLATHAHFGRSVSLKGKPVITIGNEIIRRARTIGEAVDIARRHSPVANWAYVVSSARENDAVVLELTPKKLFIRHAQDGFLAHSNYFHTPELQEEEALLSGGACDDLVARVCRMREVLEPNRGRLKPVHMAEALGDHVDAITGEERVVGNTLSVVTTIKSVVFEPESQRMWVSSRGESPMGLDAEFVQVDVDRFWDQAGEPPVMRSERRTNPALVEGVKHYREAHRAWHVNAHEPDHAEKTLISLRKAIRAYPADGNIWLQAGIVAFRARLFAEARAYFQEARARKLAPHVAHVCTLYLARCHDVLGERAEALVLYRGFQGSAADVEPKLAKAFRRGLRRPYRASETGYIMVDLQFPDTLQY
jgi:hypothetical protein